MNGFIIVSFAVTLLLGYLSDDVEAQRYCMDYDGKRVERGQMFSMGFNPCTTCVCGPNGKALDCDEMKCHVPHLPGVSPPPFRREPPERRYHLRGKDQIAATVRPMKHNRKFVRHYEDSEHLARTLH